VASPLIDPSQPVGYANREGFESVNGFAAHSGFLHPLAVGYAVYGVVLFAVLLLAGWWIARRQDRSEVMGAALWAPLGMLIAVGLNQIPVTVVAEPRPYAVLDHPLLLIAPTADPAFPSDHAVMAGAVAAGLWLVSRRLGALTTVAALLLAIARVYVGAHWPGDVAAGLLEGAAIALLGYLLTRRLLTAAVTQLTITPLRPLFTATASGRRGS
jgi:membrane-associated phospholipid phosphatase